jgi:hypothetical protein
LSREGDGAVLTITFKGFKFAEMPLVSQQIEDHELLGRAGT